MTKFVIVRHGQSVANLEERYAGCYNALLTPLGKKQAELLTEYILKTYRVDAVYSSPLSRAIETVEKIASRSGVALNVCEGLREIDGGKWEGLSLREIAENYPQDAYLWKTDFSNFRYALDIFKTPELTYAFKNSTIIYFLNLICCIYFLIL